MKRHRLALGLIMFALLITFTAFGVESQPIGMNTPAIEAVPFWQPILKDFATAIIKVFAGLFMTWITGLYDALRKYVAKIRYGQEIGIFLDSIRLAISKKAKAEGVSYWGLVTEIISIGSDLKIDPDESKRLLQIRNDIRDDAIEIAKESLSQLRGFAKDKGSKYIADRIDLLLGELQSHLFDSKKT